MPSGFVTCPDGLVYPNILWVTVAWGATYALGAEVVLIALGALTLRLQRAAPRRAAFSLALVVTCAVGALEVAMWLSHSALQFCFAPFGHVTPATAALARRLYAEYQTHAFIALGAVAVVAAIATAFTVRTFIAGWRAGRRRGDAPVA